MSRPAVFNPTLGKATPEINLLPLSARISKPSLRDASDHCQSHKYGVNRSRSPIQKKRSSSERLPQRAVSCNRAPGRSRSPPSRAAPYHTSRRKARPTPTRASPSYKAQLRSRLPYSRIETPTGSQSAESCTSISRNTMQLRKKKSRGLKAISRKQSTRKPTSGTRRTSAQDPIMCSFSDMVEGQARFGSWLEQWEARKLMA